VENRVLEIAGSETESGLKMGDFPYGQISGHEGRGSGESTTPGGTHEKECLDNS
jgi:hypothetical protein